jgi:mono/diheme cytochrome c family protein
MRDGVSRDGHHLYPALPYEHFTHVADDDLDALYSYLMTRQPVVSRTPSNRLYFPLGFRPLLAGWKWLFLYHGVFKPQTSQTAAWNRGAYLVEGLGHCGACHTPRNLAGGEERAHAYEGGVAEGWNAPAFRREGANASSWTEASLYTYLRTGTAPTHGVAGGPMGPVVHSLSGVSDSDVKAMATYIAWLMGGKSPSPKSVSPSNTDLYVAATQSQGALIFEGACAGCHEPGAPMMIQGRPSLAFVSSIQADDPNNVVQAILHGIQSPLDDDVPYMPPFAATFTDKQIAQVAGYLRARFTAKPAWPKLDHAVTVARRASAS